MSAQDFEIGDIVEILPCPYAETFDIVGKIGRVTGVITACSFVETVKVKIGDTVFFLHPRELKRVKERVMNEEKITVEELVELKTELEKEIKEYLCAKFRDFQQKTWVPVSNINISLYPVSFRPPYSEVVEDVTVEVDIDRVGEI
ncbi:hypothetical protein DRH14_02725 [Candidatus Shapirobacteria bacterium]|nr:MAG: hypothetical protein DRH14_02725 [Candidatus Shapirobacteria bacterium]